MKIIAYILIADPAWIEDSINSYYSWVSEIIVSFDETGIGWTGKPIPTAECIARIKCIDPENKLRFLPGFFSKPTQHPMLSETQQRQHAIDEACRRGADWILQLDTDEVMGDPATFFKCLEQASDQGFAAMDYPSRLLYRQLGGNRYLEVCTRFWRVSAGYPGPLAIRAGTVLRFARQCDVATFRVDFRKKNTDLFRPRESIVHRVVPADKGVFHFAWIRDEEAMRRKSKWSGHAGDLDWGVLINRWLWAGRHPRLATLLTPVMRREHTKLLRICEFFPAGRRHSPAGG